MEYGKSMTLFEASAATTKYTVQYSSIVTIGVYLTVCMNSIKCMYKSIHVVRSYRVEKINEYGPIGLNRYSGGTLEALLKNGRTFTAPFGGFIEGGNLVGLKRVKLLHIRYLCDDEEALKPSYQIPKDHYLVGVYLEHKLYVLLFDGQPKHFFDNNADLDGKNNVVRLV